jgi:hypothetical protein
MISYLQDLQKTSISVLHVGFALTLNDQYIKIKTIFIDFGTKYMPLDDTFDAFLQLKTQFSQALTEAHAALSTAYTGFTDAMFDLRDAWAESHRRSCKALGLKSASDVGMAPGDIQTPPLWITIPQYSLHMAWRFCIQDPLIALFQQIKRCAHWVLYPYLPLDLGDSGRQLGWFDNDTTQRKTIFHCLRTFGYVLSVPVYLVSGFCLGLGMSKYGTQSFGMGLDWAKQWIGGAECKDLPGFTGFWKGGLFGMASGGLAVCAAIAFGLVGLNAIGLELVKQVWAKSAVLNGEQAETIKSTRSWYEAFLRGGLVGLIGSACIVGFNIIRMVLGLNRFGLEVMHHAWTMSAVLNGEKSEEAENAMPWYTLLRGGILGVLGGISAIAFNVVRACLGLNQFGSRSIVFGWTWAGQWLTGTNISKMDVLPFLRGGLFGVLGAALGFLTGISFGLLGVSHVGDELRRRALAFSGWWNTEDHAPTEFPIQYYYMDHKTTWYQYILKAGVIGVVGSIFIISWNATKAILGLNRFGGRSTSDGWEWGAGWIFGTPTEDLPKFKAFWRGGLLGIALGGLGIVTGLAFGLLGLNHIGFEVIDRAWFMADPWSKDAPPFNRKPIEYIMKVGLLGLLGGLVAVTLSGCRTFFGLNQIGKASMITGWTWAGRWISGAPFADLPAICTKAFMKGGVFGVVLGGLGVLTGLAFGVLGLTSFGFKAIGRAWAMSASLNGEASEAKAPIVWSDRILRVGIFGVLGGICAVSFNLVRAVLGLNRFGCDLMGRAASFSNEWNTAEHKPDGVSVESDITHPWYVHILKVLRAGLLGMAGSIFIIGWNLTKAVVGLNLFGGQSISDGWDFGLGWITGTRIEDLPKFKAFWRGGVLGIALGGLGVATGLAFGFLGLNHVGFEVIQRVWAKTARLNGEISEEKPGTSTWYEYGLKVGIFGVIGSVFACVANLSRAVFGLNRFGSADIAFGWNWASKWIRGSDLPKIELASFLRGGIFGVILGGLGLIGGVTLGLLGLTPVGWNLIQRTGSMTSVWNGSDAKATQVSYAWYQYLFKAGIFGVVGSAIAIIIGGTRMILGLNVRGIRAISQGMALARAWLSGDKAQFDFALFLKGGIIGGLLGILTVPIGFIAGLIFNEKALAVIQYCNAVFSGAPLAKQHAKLKACWEGGIRNIKHINPISIGTGAIVAGIYAIGIAISAGICLISRVLQPIRYLFAKESTQTVKDLKAFRDYAMTHRSMWMKAENAEPTIATDFAKYQSIPSFFRGLWEDIHRSFSWHASSIRERVVDLLIEDASATTESYTINSNAFFASKQTDLDKLKKGKGKHMTAEAFKTHVEHTLSFAKTILTPSSN